MMIMILMYVLYLHTCILLYVANQNFQISMRTSEYLRFAASKCAISRQIIKTFMNQRMSFSCFLKKVYNSNNCCSLCLSIISDMSWCVPLLLLTNGTNKSVGIADLKTRLLKMEHLNWQWSLPKTIPTNLHQSVLSPQCFIRMVCLLCLSFLHSLIMYNNSVTVLT